MINPRGRSALENNLVLTIVALLLLTLVPTINNMILQIRDTRVEIAGRTFLESLSILHDRWLIQRSNQIGGILFNPEGWPDGTITAGKDDGLMTCTALWQVIMTQTGLTASSLPEQGSDFLVQHPAAHLCLYRYQQSQPDTRTRILLYRIGTQSVKTMIH